MSARWITCGLAVALALAAAPSARAAEGSDGFADAPVLRFSEPGAVADNVGYSEQAPAGEPVTCGTAPIARTAWWRFTGTGQQISLSTRLSTFDTVLAVFDAPSGIPIVGNRLDCNDDDPNAGGDVTSALTFGSVRGKQYLVQVGSRGAGLHGKIDLRASSPVRPGNDDRVSAQALQSGVAATVSNAGASQESGEALTCATASYAATIWFKWTATAVGDAVFSSSAAFGDTVVTVYRGATALNCNAGTTATVPVRVSPGDYLIQVGSKGSDVAGLGVGPITAKVDFAVDNDLDNDGELASTDCNDSNPAIRHGIVDIPDDGIDQNCDGVDAVNLDRDGDGENRPADCNDNNRAIHHGARDIPGNKIDEDCKGGPAPFPQIKSTVRTSWRLSPFRITKLVVLRAVAGSRVELRCQGRGCPFKRTTVKVRKSRASLPVLSRKLKRARLKRGAALEVRITKRDQVAFIRRVVVRAGTKDPRISDRCLPPHARKAKRC